MVQEDYRSQNPYHNALHAADVTQAMYCYLQEPKVRLVKRAFFFVSLESGETSSLPVKPKKTPTTSFCSCYPRMLVVDGLILLVCVKRNSDVVCVALNIPLCL